jgi:uncharacterized protein (DUF305 family)
MTAITTRRKGGELVRRRQTWWLVVAVVAAGCAAPGSNSPAISDETDVWFMRHMAGHLLQTTAILDLSSDRITRPRLARLAGIMNQQGKASLEQLQGWLAGRGLAPYDPQQQPSRRKESALARLAHLHGAKFDLALLKVMTARYRAGNELAVTEITRGTLPEVRHLARNLLVQQRGQIVTMTAWTHAWAKADPKHSTSRTSTGAVDRRRQPLAVSRRARGG